MTAAIELRPTAAPGRVGQGTAVEQSRAVAEVHAAIVVAQQCPRSIPRAERDMRRSCAQKSLADKAFYRYSRGGGQVSGPSVQLARELARCWGNIQYGVTELRRDDTFGQSEMQAWAWDVETNARSSTTFIVQHIRDTSKGSKALTDQRDIYENNANNGARRLREMVFAILPGWYVEDAVAACYETLSDDGGEGLAAAIASAVDGFTKIGVTAGQLAQKLGAPQDRWTQHDLAQLRVIYRSLMRGEIHKEDEFPGAAERVTAADITASRPSAPPAEAPAASDGAASPPQDRTRRPAKSAMAELDGLLRQFPFSGDDTTVFLAWRCGGTYRASKQQVEQVTAYLRERLDAAGGDTEEAASAIWAEYQATRPADPQDATAAASGQDGEPGE